MRKSLLLALPLAGFISACDEGQEKSLAECKLTSLQLYKGGRPAKVFEWGSYYNYLGLCMNTKGFTENAVPHRCNATDDDLT
jgi:hypothetical protein